MRYTLATARDVAGGRLVDHAPGGAHVEIAHWAHDSRLVAQTAGTCFVALPGPTRSGAAYVGELARRGVRLFCVSERDAPGLPRLPAGAALWIVDDVLAALQRLARDRRERFAGTVVGITGSNGKTIVKEWLATLLGGEAAGVYRSPGSYNSQLGVALAVLAIPASAKTAILEAGISRAGEMSALERMTRPDVGVFTMLGDAHAAGFASLREKFAEKWQLFARARAVLLPATLQTQYSDIAILRYHAGQQPVTWGYSDGPSIGTHGGDDRGDPAAPSHTEREGRGGEPRRGRASASGANLHAPPDYSADPGQGVITERATGRVVDYAPPFADAVSQHNLITALAAALRLGADPARLAERTGQLSYPDMRLNVSQGTDGLRIVDDSYTSDRAGLYAALEFLRLHRRRRGSAVAVIGLDAAPAPAELAELAARLRAEGLDAVVTIGPELNGAALEDAAPRRLHVADHAGALDALRGLDLREGVVLLKAPRRYRLDRVAAALRARRHDVRLEVNLGALAHNIAAFRERLRDPAVRVCVMVKAQAYGTGGAEVAGFFAQRGIDYLAVAYLDEGIELRRAGSTLPVIVGNADPAEAATLLEHSLEPEVTTPAQLRAFGREPGLRLHLKLDTGMHRLGFPAERGEGLDALLAQLAGLRARVASVFSHLSASDDPAADGFSRRQDARLRAAYALVVERLGYRPLLHIANSAAAWRLPDLHHDMVRLGIGVYGAGAAAAESGALEPAHRWVAEVVQVRRVAAGEVVGYGLGGAADRARTIAVVNVGYADGLRRQAGHGRYSLYVRGRAAPTVGSVCMDFTMVDVSAAPGVRAGDAAEVFGRHQPVDALAACYGTIAYEVFTGIGQRVRRVFYR